MQECEVISDRALSSGSARIYSGVDGSIITTLDGDSTDDQFGQAVSNAGDVNGDGISDAIVGAFHDDNNGSNSGSASVFVADTPPVFSYSSNLAVSTLTLIWVPNGGNINAATGLIVCLGAFPGGGGIFGVSLAPANLVIYGFPLLIAIDGANLIDTGNFGFDLSGSVGIPGVSRQHPALAGNYVFIQFYESSPVLASSNGIAMLLVP